MVVLRQSALCLPNSSPAKNWTADGYVFVWRFTLRMLTGRSLSRPDRNASIWRVVERLEHRAQTGHRDQSEVPPFIDEVIMHCLTKTRTRGVPP